MNPHRNAPGADERSTKRHVKNGSGRTTRTHELTRTRIMSTTDPVADSSIKAATHKQVSVYEECVEELYELMERKAELEAESSANETEESDEYTRIKRRIAAVKEHIDEVIAEFGDDEFTAVYRRLDDEQAHA